MRHLQRLPLAGRVPRVIYYAAHTCGVRNRATLARLGFGMLGSAAYRWTDREWCARDRGGHGWALDNGAWSAFKAGTAFNAPAYCRAVQEAGRLDFVVCPDVVMDAEGTRDLSALWLPWTLANADAARVLLPVQNGMENDALPLSPTVGVFVGGDDRWKEQTLPLWRRRTDEAGAYLHVGRVNTARRLESCVANRVDSCDGSGASRFSVHAEKIEGWRRGAENQGRLFR